MKKKNVVLSAGIGLVTSGLYVGALHYLYNNAVKGHNKPAKTADTTDYSVLNTFHEIGQQFLEEHPYKEVVIESHDHLKLTGYMYLQPSDRWCILVHGYQCNASSMNYQAKQFYDHGFNVLCVDCRGHGKSEGDYIGFGWHDRLDIVKWIEYILFNSPNAKIVLYGVSMGAATVMMTTGEELPSNVVCAIEDCGYSDIYEVFSLQIKKLYHLPSAPILTGIDVMMRKKAGYSLFDVDSITQLKKSKTPTLFIHGQEDDFVPFTMVFENYNACNAEKELITASQVGHALSQTKRYYYLKVFEFINRYL